MRSNFAHDPACSAVKLYFPHQPCLEIVPVHTCHLGRGSGLMGSTKGHGSQAKWAASPLQIQNNRPQIEEWACFTLILLSVCGSLEAHRQASLLTSQRSHHHSKPAPALKVFHPFWTCPFSCPPSSTSSTLPSYISPDCGSCCRGSADSLEVSLARKGISASWEAYN